MNEVTKEGYSAIEQALRDEVIEPRVEPKKFERRHTVELPIPESSAERVARKWERDAHSPIREEYAPGQVAVHYASDKHSPIPLPPAVEAPVSHMDAMLTEKNSIHGDFTQDATTAQALKYVMRQGKNWEDMPPWMREALEQMQTKVARILAGDFTHPDHWKDLQGYPRLVETRLEKK